MQTYLQKLPLLIWARYAYMAGIVFSLIGLIPTPWFPLQLGKLLVATLFISLAGVLFALGGGLGGVVGKRGYRMAWLITLLPLVYILSYFLSTDRSVGLLGYSIETDTVCFVIIAAFTFLISFFLFRRIGSVRPLLSSISLAACLAILFQFISIFFGVKILPTVFSNPSINLVGKWNDLGLLAGVCLLVLLIVLECVPLSMRRRVGLFCLAIVTVLFLAVVQYSAIWALLLGMMVIVGTWSFVTSRKLPWVSIVAGVICIFFLVWGTGIQSGLVKVFPVSSFEIRPSFGTTLDVVRLSHGTSVKEFLLGSGPGTFSNEWPLYKPVAINQSQYWNLSFNAGYSIFTTAFGTVGVVGMLAWCIPFILVLFGLVQTINRRELFNWYEQTAILMCASTSTYLWIAAFVYPPNQNIILLAFALSGASFALTMKNDAGTENSAISTRMQRLVLAAVVFALVVAAIVSVSVARRFITEKNINQGAIALGNADIEGALNKANAALAVEKTGDSLQFAAQAGLSAMGQLAQSTSTPSTQLQQQFTSLAQTTIELGRQAIQANPNDYRAHFILARIYDLLASVGVEGAYSQAKQFYTSAQAHNPSDPGIPLAIARLEYAQKNKQATTDALKEALTLKQDYTDAILFAVQMYVAEKDMNNAIVAAKAAVNSAPGIASIWFQLGLLYYSNNNMTDAESALEKAVEIQADYANAKYFLGLTYAALKKTPEAIKQFVDLSVTNPDNSEVRLILSNLKIGKPPFDGAEPPVTSNPEDRETAPISQ